MKLFQRGHFHDTNKESARQSWKYPLPLFLSLLILYLTAHVILTAVPVQAGHKPLPATLFLPLKINTPLDETGLTENADAALAKALQVNVVRQQAFTIIDREKAQKLFDYQQSWPPSMDELLNFATESATAATYVAAGSLTRLGDTVSIDIKVYDLLDPSSQTFYYLDGRNLNDLEASLDSIAGDILAYTGRSYLIASIGPAGNTRIDSGAILRNITSRTGDLYEADKLRSDLKNVFKMGYFDDVRLKVADTEEGKTVVFEVKEKPVISEVTVSGQDELKEDAIREVISVIPNTILNPKKIREAANNIQALYKSKGFYNTNVTPNLSYPQSDRVNIRFAIEEGKKVFIKDIRFAGNTTFKNSKLEKVMGTKEKGWLSWFNDSGVLNLEMLEQDAARITAFYHNNGFIEVKVDKPEIVQEEEWLYITIEISEGERYKVGNVDLSGDIIGTKDEILALLRVLKKEYLDRSILRSDILWINDYYAEQGYAYAEASPTINTNKEEKLVDIIININKGDLVYINRITIKGNARTRDKVIRRELLVREKGVFDSKALRLSHQRLQRLDFFEEVSINPEPTPEKTMMDLIVEVKEKPTGAFSIGAGYSSVDSIMFMGEISQNNLLGRGQRLALQVNLSGTSTRFNISFTEPHLYDTQLMAGFDLYRWERDYDTYVRDSQGFAARLGYPVWELWKMILSYGFDDTDLKDIDDDAPDDIIESQHINITSYVGLNLTRDTRNSMFVTTRGSQNVMRSKYAGGPLGGDSEFTKVDGFTSWFFPGFFFDKTAFHFKLSAGQVWENEADSLADFERFYLGGINTIRGFETRSIGVKKTDPETGVTEIVGGKYMWFTNIEYLFPIVERGGLRGLVFFDAGNVYGDKWDFNEIKKSVGTGLRWLSPMGPMRLEWGYVIKPDDDEDSSNWDFSMGGSF
ncbi:MAG: outer membrane protein assembly factor BamA [Proteobacteria bacterium]|nr:outer membrane protein assembly factor BamA [Pseudomonadota bacterium]